MSEATPGRHLGAAEPYRQVTFQASKAFGRGYDQTEVDVYIRGLLDRLRAAEQEVQRLGLEVAERGDEAIQAVSILTNAKRAADSTLAEANAYSSSVMTEARELHDETQRRAAALEQEAAEKARALLDQAVEQASALERDASAKATALYDDTMQRMTAMTLEAETATRAAQEETARKTADLEKDYTEKVRRLTREAAFVQQELDAQTAQLRTLRDATRAEMQKFHEGLLEYLGEHYGPADPRPAEVSRSDGSHPRPTDVMAISFPTTAGEQRGRRAPRLAGRPAYASARAVARSARGRAARPAAEDARSSEGATGGSGASAESPRLSDAR